MMDEYRRLADQPALPARKEGDASEGHCAAPRTRYPPSYEFPYLAHAPMEPLDAVVKLDAESCEIWAGDQFQTVDQVNAARTAGLTPQQVSIHTLYAGGSFGRRANTGSDYIVEAVSIAKACGADGTPIKLQWTREDDIHGGLYRPMYFHKLEAGLNAQDELTGWQHVIVGQSIMAGTPFAAAIKDGIDATSVEGAANIAYAIPNIAVDLSTTQAGVPVLWWRVVGSSHTTFAVESFIDEVAHAAGARSLRVSAQAARARAAHEGRARTRRRQGGLERGAAAARARAAALRWPRRSKPSSRRSPRSASMRTGRVKVDRVVCAVDCGTPINPDIITAQMEGGIGFGLGAALYGSDHAKDGRIEQDNFNGYRVLRMNEMPEGRSVYRALDAKRPPASASPA